MNQVTAEKHFNASSANRTKANLSLLNDSTNECRHFVLAILPYTKPAIAPEKLGKRFISAGCGIFFVSLLAFEAISFFRSVGDFIQLSA